MYNMRNEHKSDEELKRAMALIQKEASPVRIILFGSRARKDSLEESDFDILVIVHEETDNRLLAESIYLLFARERIKIPIDLIVESWKRFEQRKENPFTMYYHIHKEGKVLYDETGKPQ